MEGLGGGVSLLQSVIMDNKPYAGTILPSSKSLQGAFNADEDRSEGNPHI